MPKMPTSSREKLLMKVLVGILAVLVLVVGGRVVMGGGGAKSSSTSPTISGANSGPAVSPRTKGPVLPPLPFTGVDPFEPLVAAAPSPSAAPASPAATPASVPPPTPTPTPTPTTTTTPSTAIVGGHTVSLLEVFSNGGTDQAVVMVDTTVYTVKTGDQFGDFSVTSISPPCATFGWQDQAFDLCAPGSGA
jgi:hypothetical protein